MFVGTHKYNKVLHDGVIQHPPITAGSLDRDHTLYIFLSGIAACLLLILLWRAVGEYKNFVLLFDRCESLLLEDRTKLALIHKEIALDLNCLVSGNDGTSFRKNFYTKENIEFFLFKLVPATVVFCSFFYTYLKIKGLSTGLYSMVIMQPLVYLKNKAFASSPAPEPDLGGLVTKFDNLPQLIESHDKINFEKIVELTKLIATRAYYLEKLSPLLEKSDVFNQNHCLNLTKVEETLVKVAASVEQLKANQAILMETIRKPAGSFLSSVVDDNLNISRTSDLVESVNH